MRPPLTVRLAAAPSPLAVGAAGAASSPQSPRTGWDLDRSRRSALSGGSNAGGCQTIAPPSSQRPASTDRLARLHDHSLELQSQLAFFLFLHLQGHARVRRPAVHDASGADPAHQLHEHRHDRPHEQVLLVLEIELSWSRDAALEGWSRDGSPAHATASMSRSPSLLTFSPIRSTPGSVQSRDAPLFRPPRCVRSRASRPTSGVPWTRPEADVAIKYLQDTAGIGPVARARFGSEPGHTAALANILDLARRRFEGRVSSAVTSSSRGGRSICAGRRRPASAHREITLALARVSSQAAWPGRGARDGRAVEHSSSAQAAGEDPRLGHGHLDDSMTFTAALRRRHGEQVIVGTPGYLSPSRSAPEEGRRADDIFTSVRPSRDASRGGAGRSPAAPEALRRDCAAASPAPPALHTGPSPRVRASSCAASERARTAGSRIAADLGSALRIPLTGSGRRPRFVSSHGAAVRLAPTSAHVPLRAPPVAAGPHSPRGSPRRAAGPCSSSRPRCSTSRPASRTFSATPGTGISQSGHGFPDRRPLEDAGPSRSRAGDRLLEAAGDAILASRAVPAGAHGPRRSGAAEGTRSPRERRARGRRQRAQLWAGEVTDQRGTPCPPPRTCAAHCAAFLRPALTARRREARRRPSPRPGPGPSSSAAASS